MMSRASMDMFDKLTPEQRALANEYGLNYVLNLQAGGNANTLEEFSARCAAERQRRMARMMAQKPEEPEEYRRREEALRALVAPHVVSMTVAPEPWRGKPPKRGRLRRMLGKVFR